MPPCSGPNEGVYRSEATLLVTTSLVNQWGSLRGLPLNDGVQILLAKLSTNHVPGRAGTGPVEVWDLRPRRGLGGETGPPARPAYLITTQARSSPAISQRYPRPRPAGRFEVWDLARSAGGREPIQVAAGTPPPNAPGGLYPYDATMSPAVQGTGPVEVWDLRAEGPWGARPDRQRGRHNSLRKPVKIGQKYDQN